MPELWLHPLVMGGRISRNRGYKHEHYLVQSVNRIPDWYCKRLGGSSTSMPDLLCINNVRKIIRVSECKSLMTDNKKSMLYIPADQVQRCIDFAEIFTLYTTREVIFSFKFGRGYENSYFFLLEPILYERNIIYVRCSYNGICDAVMTNSQGKKTYFPLRPRENLIS